MARTQTLPKKQILKEFLIMYAYSDFTEKQIKEYLASKYKCAAVTIGCWIPTAAEIDIS